GDRIIGMALDFLRRIREEKRRSLSISINISAIQLLRKDFTDNLFSIIKEMDIPPQYITLEITETIFSMNYEEMNSTLGKLMDYGLHIAIDDFGTGYSTLARE
ncbi:MAG TPA: sensor domain-containing phosphodiesterase, partial [Clostridiaceae bacterium]|nr:sensor domain-containing phosphodiesterase [Clostridiaceae bacterium]